MKAAAYFETGGPDVFQYLDVPDPELQPDGLIVEVAAVGIQGGDLLHRERGQALDQPHVVGYQAAGVVNAVGDQVEGFDVGQRVAVVTSRGSHAELVGVPSGSAFAIPESLSLEAAACIPVEFGTASDCLVEFGDLRAGESVLVHAGAGGVGLAAIQLAKRAGASKVIATASSDERLERLREFGMDHGINYATEPEVARQVWALTDRRGVDLVVDPVGGRTLEASIASLAYRGRISWVGQASRDDRPPDVWPIMQRNGRITGVYLGAELDVNPERTRSMISSLIDRVSTGELTAVIDRTFPLAEAAEAHRYIESRQAFGRVLLRP